MLFREKMVSMLRELGRLNSLLDAAPAHSGDMAQAFLGCRTTQRAISPLAAMPYQAAPMCRPVRATSFRCRRCLRQRLRASRSPAEFERAFGVCSVLMS